MGLASVVLAILWWWCAAGLAQQELVRNETWNGTLTVSRAGQPDLVGPATWTFELVPQTGRQNFNTTIRSQNMWISVTTTSTIVLTPTADPSRQIGGTGHRNSPRGCTGDFVTTGNATQDRSQERAQAKNDAYGIGKVETRHPRWERCRALWSALERPVCFHEFSRILALQSAAPCDGGDDHVRET